MPTSNIANLTQHRATADQIMAGVFDLAIQGDDFAAAVGLRQDQFGYYARLSDVLTFDSLSSTSKMTSRAILLAQAAIKSGATHAMIGGAPFFMPTLERVLAQSGIQPLYAFSVRESVETVQPNGTVAKTAVFRHAGFVKADVVLGMPDAIEEV